MATPTKGFEHDVARLGGGAAPLWLRMEPLRFDSLDAVIFRLPYVALDVRLDLHQVWAPSGIERISKLPQLRARYAECASRHRRNVARLREMARTGSLGWISDIALALIEQTGRNPAHVMREERAAGLNGGGHARYGCNSYFGALFCHDGILTPYLDFAQCSYHNGTLTIDGSYPATLAQGAPGNLLAAYVDHPAFEASCATITRAKWHEDRLELFHEPNLVTVEEAERRWRSSIKAGTGAKLGIPNAPDP